MIIKNILSSSLLFIGTTGVVLADQVLSYKLTWDETDQRYHVFMKPSKTPVPNLTTTAQVTIKVPHLSGADRFAVGQVTSKVNGTLWLSNSRIDAPAEAPDSDYISFSLTMLGGPNSFDWQKDTEIEVFSFANTGSCTAPISLLNNETDPFAVPNNSASTNPGNQFSNLGWGAVGENNYLNNYQAEADCRSGVTDGTGGGSPVDSSNPPVDQPPVVDPNNPPVDLPPEVDPSNPPIDQPPVDQPPVDQPPAVDPSNPPVDQPPVDPNNPPVDLPPTVDNPVDSPVVNDPPVVETPVNDSNTDGNTNDSAGGSASDNSANDTNNPQEPAAVNNDAPTAQADANNAGQVLDYKIAWSDVDNKYHVFMKPSSTPSPDLTLTGQITIKVPHGSDNNHFTVGNLTSNIDGVIWTLTSRVDAPQEAPQFDYLSFSFTTSNAQAFHWQANQEKEVFSFSNTASCTGDVIVMPQDDPFNVPQNSASTNPGNQFSNLGWGDATTNNYHGIYGGAASACSINNNTPDSSPADTAVLDYKVTWDDADNKYHVFMKPSVTPNPVDLSLTGQITLKVPHGTGSDEFKVENLSSAIAGTDWTLASHIKAPAEAPDYDYLSFVVTISNAQAFHWQADQEQEVFSFSNPSNCLGDVIVMPIDDPFNQPNNSASTNPGNQFTNLGWGTASDNNYHGTYGSASALCPLNDADDDGLPNSIERIDQDRDNDGINDREDFDPTGYFYCSSNGKILSGGSIAVEGPGNANIIANGSTGYYQFTVDTTGEYIMHVSPPAGTKIDPNYPASDTVLDPTGQANPYVIGSGEKASTGVLSDPSPAANTPWYNKVNVESGDPIVINNNIPLVGSACGDNAIDGSAGQDHKHIFKPIPTLSEWAKILLALMISVFAVRGLLRKDKRT